MYKHIPFTVVALSALLFVALVLLLVGGTIAGWNIWHGITSPIAYLIYVVAAIVIVTIVFFKYFYNSGAR